MKNVQAIAQTSSQTRQKRSWVEVVCFLGIFWLLFFNQSASAQNYQNVAPQVPASQNSGSITPPPREAPTKKGDEIIVATLLGIKFVDDNQKIIPTGLCFEGIYNDGLPLIDTSPTLKAEINQFIGKPLTFNGLKDLSNLLVTFYREHDHPLVSVVFPEQDISSGSLQVLITEFRVGKIGVVGNQWFTDDQILSGLRLHPGEQVVYSKLEEDLDWINKNPFRSVDAIFAPGEETGTTNINLKTEDELPVRAYVGYDNTGTPNIGRSRWNLGANWGNAFWANQILSYQFTSSDNFWVNQGRFLNDPSAASFTAHSLDDVIPLPWHDKIDIFGTYTKERPELGPDFGQVGHSGQASIRYIHTLPTFAWLSEEVQVGYDYKTTNNNLEFDGQQVFTTSSDVDQFLFIYKGNLKDILGQTALSNTFVYSPGGLTAGNNAVAYQQGGNAYANADYFYDNLQLTRSMPLFWSTSSVTRFVGQLSNGNLVSSEQLGAGGENSVRGYNERAVNGSEGVLFSQEWRSPSFNMARFLFDEDVGDQTQFLTFWDLGSVSDNKTPLNSPSSSQLSSVGLGVRYGLGNSFNLQGDYGWQLLKAPGAASLGSLAHVALTMSY